MDSLAPHRIIIEPSSGWQMIDWNGLWRHRELLGFLVWRDIQIRYKQTILGVLWALIQPVMTMVVFTVFFGGFGGMSRNVEGHYALFVLAGLLPWQLFATAVGQAGNSLVNSGSLISKVYFPRLIIPLSSVGSAIIDFGVAFVILLALASFSGISWGLPLLAAPVFVAGTILAAVGIGTLLSALVIEFRDFRYVMTFLLQIWMFASPVAYPVSIVPAEYRLCYSLNPMVGMISGFRWAVLQQPCDWNCILTSWAVTLLCLAAGLAYFRRMERRFADVI